MKDREPQSVINEIWTPLERVIGRDIFKAEVRAWAERMCVDVKEMHIRPMKRKWGSCSTAGRLSFNTELLSAPAEFRRKVIVHELLHLKLPNHGKLFQALLRSYLGKDPHDRLMTSIKK
jgi:predicted metal-dependent hydrolase